MPIIGSLGATFFAASMPLMGLEFKVVSLILLVATLLWMMRSRNYRTQSVSA